MTRAQRESYDGSSVSGTHPKLACRRRHVRTPVELPVFVLGRDQRGGPGVCRDIGLGGVSIATDLALDYGDEIVVVLEAPRVAASGLTVTQLRLPATVRWRDASAIGAQFGALRPTETEALLAAIRQSAGRY